jgi:hypothetical protein
MLDYSIIGPSPLPYHLNFMVGLTEEVSPSSLDAHFIRSQVQDCVIALQYVPSKL